MSLLTKTSQINTSALKQQNVIIDWFVKNHILAVFIFLLIIEICTFASIVSRTGVYLDEWSYFTNLHFCRQSWLDCFKCLLFNDRIIIRPAYTPYFATLYYLFNEKPFGYHLFNQGLELAGALFLYMALCPILKNRVLSFLAAALFLIYPTHDLTHHSISAASTTIAVTLFTLSLWLFAQGILESNRRQLIAYKLIFFSAVAFLCSLLNYEICLSLFVIFPVTAIILLWKTFKPTKTLVLAGLYSLPSLFAIALTFFYRSFLLPSFKVGWGYRIVFDPINFFHVIAQGIKVSISPYAFSFFSKIAGEFMVDSFDIGYLLALIIAGIALAAGTWLLAKIESNSLRQSSILAIVLGALILVSAYVVFGLSPDYLPVLDSGINRINSASAIGAAMIIVGLLGICISFIKQTTPFVQSLILSSAILPILFLLMLANWAFAGPWIVSWKAQQQVIHLIEKHGKQINSGDTILLAALPRYTMWAPVFDGVWDFQSALRITLNRSDINGGVLSDRMILTPTALEDKYQNFLCARYPLKQLIVLIPGQKAWIPIQSPQHLVDLAKQYKIALRQDNSLEHFHQ